MVGKLRPLDQRKVIKILEKNGFEKVRTRKHMTFKKKDPKNPDRMLITWVPLHKEVTLFVVKHIIRQTGKLREEFY